MNYLKILFALFITTAQVTGCTESSFKLSKESRLPKWLNIPDGLSRNDVYVTMDYYVESAGRIAIFKLYDKHGNVLRQVTGKQRGLHPIKLNNPSLKLHKTNRPLFEIITVDGLTDIIEHRERNSLFHVTDNPKVWKVTKPQTNKVEP